MLNGNQAAGSAALPFLPLSPSPSLPLPPHPCRQRCIPLPVYCHGISCPLLASALRCQHGYSTTVPHGGRGL